MVNSPLSEQDVNWSNVNKYTNKKIKKKTFAYAPETRCLAGWLVKTLLSQAIFVTRVVHLKLNFKRGHKYRNKSLRLQGES